MVTRTRGEILADGATRDPTDTYALDLIAWAVADAYAGDPVAILDHLAALQGPSVWEQLTGTPL